jgi:hypothetical protein
MLKAIIKSKMYLKLRFLIFWMLISITIGNAQNFTEDFKAINRAYVTGDLSFNIKYDYYNELKSKVPSYFYSGVVKVKGNLVYYKMNGIEFSSDSNYICIIDESNKTIMIDSVHNNGNQFGKFNIIDSLAKAYKSIKYSDEGNNLGKYTIYSVLPGVSHSEVIFDKTTKLLQKVTIYFLDDRPNAKEGAIRNKMVVLYSNINNHANNGYGIFKVQRVLKIQGREVNTTLPYKNYKIINNMEQ